jgi:aldehyde:ferredoxin oxidoreductase
LVTDKETLLPLAFGDVEKYREAVRHLGQRTNDFYRCLGQGTLVAATRYGGSEFACVLGQEMAGYATGEVFFASQAYGLRHSHLDNAGYSCDQKADSKRPEDAVAFLIEEERRRVQLTCMVSCLFGRNVYSEERLQECLSSIGFSRLANSVVRRSKDVQNKRWQLKYLTGYNPATVPIPKRFGEVITWKGPVDTDFMHAVAAEYQDAVRKLADIGQCVQC